MANSGASDLNRFGHFDKQNIRKFCSILSNLSFALLCEATKIIKCAVIASYDFQTSLNG